METTTVLLPPLHAAIWEGDVNRVRRILQESKGNQVDGAESDRDKHTGSRQTRALLLQRDAHGNTPLHLAVRVIQPSQRAIVQMLLEHGASVGGRSSEGWSCVHDATLCDDEFLLAQLFLHGERQLWSEVEDYQDDFLNALERLPDFEVEIFVEAYSWIPGVSKMLPSQTNRIYKRGSQLRIDSSMKGLERFQLNHGRISHIFTGRTPDHATGGRAFVVNHDLKAFYDISGAVKSVSSAAKIDLGIHVLVSKEASATSIDSSRLEFSKLKDVKEIKTKQKNGSSRRQCPWTGTKYEMKNFSATFAFRNPQNPKRQHRQFAGEGINATEAALGVIDSYVSELSVSSSTETAGRGGRGKRSMMDTNIHDDESDSEHQHASAGGHQELWLPKGKHMEMHLDVLAGDCIGWKYTCGSKEFTFTATSYQGDTAVPVSRCEGAKNAAIVGSFVAESNGSFVLRWQNTHKGFTLDKKGMKIVYNVTHTRPAAVAYASNPTSQIDAVAVPQPPAMSLAQRDLEVCHQFLRSDHIPNPMTVTMSLSEYLSPSSSQATSHKEIGSSIFKRSSKHHHSNTLTRDTTQQTAGPIIASDGTEHRNTFRSLTLLPTPRRFHKNFEGKLFMAHDFPIQMHEFLPVVEFLAKTGDQVKNLADFFRMKLPPGFPVRFELPMMFTVRAAYTFQKAAIRDDLDPALFALPAGYTRVASIKDILPQQH